MGRLGALRGTNGTFSVAQGWCGLRGTKRHKTAQVPLCREHFAAQTGTTPYGGVPVVP
jgi:hypothetical protein